MPRAGLNAEDVAVAAAGLADEIGFQAVTMGLVAERLGVRPPSLYKHVGGLEDLRHRVATLAMTEVGEIIGDAVQGKARVDALAAALTAFRRYVTAHPGRYAATVATGFTGPGDPLLAATARVLNSIAAVLRGYGVGEDEMDHAIRTIRCMIHGFAVLETAGGFQWDADPEQSFDWMIRFLDRALLVGQARAA